ncbi:MAG: lamin tail domain-containing protein, partial [bacterium]|nr:lamin tail domain-containing protein [bacterium]
IMWMGSSVNSSDEWLELRNRTSNTVDLSNWVVENLGSGTNSVTIPQGKSIAPNGYFLIANDPKETGAHNIDPDLVTSIGITNSPSEQLVLRISSGGTIIDTADNSSGGWFAGVSGTGQNPDLSMERNDTPGDGIVGTNWHTATTATNIDAGAPDIATPRAVNSAP